jgi:hypothetical protein
MRTFPFLPRVLVAMALLASVFSGMAPAADDTQVTFDLPDTIECRDVSPKKFAASHPSLKVIEAKLRISARIIDGAETEVVDFLYLITSPGLHMKIQDYLPNTTLESTVEGDQIEIADTNESSVSTGEDAHINYKVLGLGGTMNQGSKKTESSHYKQIAAKALVVASGTTNREHGVFFKLRPSKGASLEGAKTFTFLAVVPNTWRGDWCILACAARAKKKSFLSTGVAVAGVAQAHVGMYLSGDREARFRAEELCEVQEANGSVLSTQLAKDGAGLVAAMHAATTTHPGVGHSWLHGIFGGGASSQNGDQPNDDLRDEPNTEQRKLEVQKAMLDVQERLNRLSGSRF